MVKPTIFKKTFFIGKIFAFYFFDIISVIKLSYLKKN